MSKFLSTVFGGNDFVLRLLALQVGRDARVRAATVGHEAIWGLEASSNPDVATLRAVAVIGQLPLAIAKAIAAAAPEQAEVKLSVMQLNSQDYPGSLPRMVEPTVPDVQDLGQCGASVFQYLRMAGLQPALEYVYDGDTRTYSLDITVRVATN